MCPHNPSKHDAFTPPKEGTPITISHERLHVPPHPIIPFIEGDGIGRDIWQATKRVLEAAVRHAYGDNKRLIWMEVYAGEKAHSLWNEWLPEETVACIRKHLVAIKGPLTTPVATSIRSINVALRQQMDLYVCLRPIRYYEGVPSPVKEPEKVNMIIFRENSEDLYAGIEFQEGSPEASKLIQFLTKEMGVQKIRFPETSGIGIKPISKEGSTRLIKAAIEYAIKHDLPSVTLVHKGNIMKYTEGSFREWGFEVAKTYFNSVPFEGGPWQVIRYEGKELIIKDCIADAFLQQILVKPKDFDVIATMNLNGDYMSDALAAQVGGIGISPGANINYQTGIGLFEATHGTAPKYANRDVVNPSSLILSGEMMLRYMGWDEAANILQNALIQTIKAKEVTMDFSRLMEGVRPIKCSEFGNAIISHMEKI